MQMDDVPEERPNEAKSLPARLSPKPLPALPLPQFRDIYETAPFLQPQHVDTQSRFSPPGINGGHEYGSAMDHEVGSTLFSDASNAPSPSNTANVRESSPGGIMDSAEFQAILDHEWGTAFHIPGNTSPISSIIEDPFMRMVEQYDPVYNKNRYAWTFKKNPPVRRPSRPSNTPKGSSEPNHPDETGPSNKEKEREKVGEGEPAVIMWSCQNVGQYGVWPGRSSKFYLCVTRT
jgi:hypothetical protein